MKLILQASNIGSYMYIFIGNMMTYWLFQLFMSDYNAVLLLIVYDVLMLFVFRDFITRKRFKIEYNLPTSDLQRIQPILSKVVQKAIKKGYEVPFSYRIAYIQDPYSMKSIAFNENCIALSRDLLDSVNDEQLSGILAHELGHLYYRHPFLESFVYSSNIVVVLLFILIEFCAGSIGYLFANLKFRIATFLTTLFIGKTSLLYIFVQSLKAFASKDNEIKCDEFACDLNEKIHLIEALLIIQNNQKNQKQSIKPKVIQPYHDLKTRIFLLKSK